MRRSLLGYRPADVKRALSEARDEAEQQTEAAQAQHDRAAGLEQALLHSHQSCGERDRRVAELQAELDRARAESTSQTRGLALLGAELQELRVSARGRATRIRLAALREAAEVSASARRLGAGEAAESALAAIERAVERLGTDWAAEQELESDVPEAPLPEAGAGVGGAGAAEADPGQPAGAATPTSANGAADPSGSTNGGRRVSVDIGPFSDFSQLVSFEDAANSIGGTSEIAIRRFSGGRASIDVDLAEPVDLLRELEERCDLQFDVRRNSDDEIVLDLDE